MASYDNLMMEQLCSLRPTFSDSWFTDVFTKETETLTKSLQSSLVGASSNGEFFSTGLVESLFTNPDTTPTVSGVSENEALVSKKRRTVPQSGRVSKRKSRPSRRAAMTTFINTDPENFMQMVQQVTGVSIDGLNEQVPVAPVLKPEPHGAADYGLTTLDTSTFLLNGSAASSLVSQPPPMRAAYGGAGASEHYLDSFCSFPTLESWKPVE